MAKDYSAELVRDLSTLTSLQDFCKEWTSRWRGVAVAAQGIVKIFFPPGAEVIGFLIGIADAFCANPAPSK
jgi:hypothetical protein